MKRTHWQRKDVSEHYLEQVRGGIPYGPDQTKMMLNVINHFQTSPRTVIDVGCGNGFLAEILLQMYPRASAILIDHSEPMIDAAKEHMRQYKDRCEFLLADFSHGLKQVSTIDSVDCIVSGFAIHHLPDEQKQRVYQQIYDLLADGGVFINIEHVASATPQVEALHDQLFIHHLSTYNNRHYEDVEQEYHERPDKEDNILQRVDIQVDWLRDIGFQHADCFFKWMELSVFGGVK
ncbi:hypothetical protein J416_12959 [Gracilibacillus halophilus YIM-C55.5]|uniref:Methyltransferase domain-containing protein n=1 Tax=Gracilibacillus halophilus YIM-C55.5 TaxID=1308866 RepID=N4WIS0_9BACI|nr:class I SAM-dependent methyltransferase [Gracilibacillus halophilus]ENH96037.1 hypothetical protein J416_12959 [Gracilibacillus halophilus YIM-C55.5]